MWLDLNADVGEGYGAYAPFESDELYNLITSANIACGFHAGDPLGMQRAIKKCLENGIGIGAHPGYRDLIGFGRRPITMPYEELVADVWYQLGALDACAEIHKGYVSHVKLHGALYNQTMKDRGQAEAIVLGVSQFKRPKVWLALANSVFIDVCKEHSVSVFSEVFADRGYLDDGSLAPRNMPGALIHDVSDAIEHVKRMVFDAKVKTISGKLIPIQADSICIHGDHEKALSMALKLRQTLENEGVRFRAISRGTL